MTLPTLAREVIGGDVVWLLGYHRGALKHQFRACAQRMTREHLHCFLAGYITGYTKGGK